MSRSGRVALGDARECSGGPPGSLRVVGSPYRLSGSDRDALGDVGSGREALPEVWEWSGGPPDVQEWSGSPPECSGVVERPSLMFGNGREALQNVQE